MGKSFMLFLYANEKSRVENSPPAVYFRTMNLENGLNEESSEM